MSCFSPPTSKLFTERNIVLPDEVCASIRKVDVTNEDTVLATASTLAHYIKEEAKAHGAPFQEKNFARVFKAIEHEDVNAYFLSVRLEDSFPMFAGAMIDFPSVMLVWKNGKLFVEKATYIEDMCVDPELSARFRKQVTLHAPDLNIGLGTYFLNQFVLGTKQNQFGHFTSGSTVGGIITEPAADNGVIQSIMTRMGATIQQPPQTPVVEFSDPHALDSFTKKREIELIEPSFLQDKAFVYLWTSKDQRFKMAASYTKAIGTFTGNNIARVQLSSWQADRYTPNASVASDVVKTFLQAGEQHIKELGWLDDNTPSLPPENALMSMKIHALYDRNAAAALRKINGLKPRVLGDKHTMMPAAFYFQPTHQEIMAIPRPKQRVARHCQPTKAPDKITASAISGTRAVPAASGVVKEVCAL